MIYSDPLSCVRLYSHLTDWFAVVRQGESLSPVLFSIFIGDLETELRESNTSICVWCMNILNLMYADDVVLMMPQIGTCKYNLTS